MSCMLGQEAVSSVKKENANYFFQKEGRISESSIENILTIAQDYTYIILSQENNKDKTQEDDNLWQCVVLTPHTIPLCALPGVLTL